MRIAFAGTPEFALESLRRTHASGFDVVLVLTQPDRPSGRGLKLHPSPVKHFAALHGLPIEQPRSLRLDGKYAGDAQQALHALRAASPDAIVVAAYGLLLPPWLLELPRQAIRVALHPDENQPLPHVARANETNQQRSLL